MSKQLLAKRPGAATLHATRSGPAPTPPRRVTPETTTEQGAISLAAALGGILLSVAGEHHATSPAGELPRHAPRP
ncbi:hypothetical protein [Pseudactinotalea suaedae]|uniref:hypothetical protein n=1 Tax=Pseudactinotalea suaedae TaxID=1524924 RepID=UPI0012E121C0|nr:hypothetical protein [Pseudactinotalea suaedae]